VTFVFSLHNICLYFSADPSEKRNLAGYKPVMVQKMKKRLERFQKKAKAQQSKRNVKDANPKRYNGVWTPGWC
jgi:hypothetical protein